MKRGQTPSQTVGPFFAYGLVPEQYNYSFTSIADGQMVDDTTEGQRIRILGHVYDGAGDLVPDAIIEIWQANSHGRYNHPADSRKDNLLDPDFKGFGRMGTGTTPDNRFVFDTIKPGSVDGAQAPHLNVVVLMRGILLHAYTRIYFSDEGEANAADAVLSSVPDERRETLIARRDVELPGRVYRFDIHMQGDRETVFFDV
ncbi:MAG: protocatechuate 3,4-dioxygenase subunit alpha [Alphaproteobacteria bacterium]|jgi:protocatechuate 3,4-dioxygenase, alpha subunit|nr:protocatechuate 3,4-dioxygenase subunit alpha [Alphaproteobacteria bacterium]